MFLPFNILPDQKIDEATCFDAQPGPRARRTHYQKPDQRLSREERLLERMQYTGGRRGGERCESVRRRARGRKVGMSDAQRVGFREVRGGVRVALEASHYSHDYYEWQAITLEVCFHDKLMTRAPVTVISAAITRSLCPQHGMMIVARYIAASNSQPITSHSQTN